MDELAKQEIRSERRSIGMTTRMVSWFLSMAVLPLLALGTITYRYGARFIKDEAASKLIAVRDLNARAVTEWVDALVMHAESVSDLLRLEGVDRLFQNALPPDEAAALEQKIHRLLASQLAHDPALRELVLIDARSARVRISTSPAREGIDRSRASYFVGPMKTGRSFISDIYLSPREGLPVLEAAAPVRTMDRQGGRIVGVLAIRVELQRSLFALLLDRSGMGETGETFLVDREQLALSELRWMRGAVLRVKARVGAAVMSAQGQAGAVEAADYRGAAVLASSSTLPRTGWGLIAKQDLSELYAPVGRLFERLVVAGIALSLVITLLAIFVGRAIARPILDMSRVARRLGAGDLDARWTATGKAELGVTGRSLNAMADALVEQVDVERDLAEVAAAAARCASVEELASELLGGLLSLTGACMAAFHRRDETGDLFRPVRSVGLSTELLEPFGAADLEGQLGLVLATGKLSHLGELPESTRFRFRTVVGEATPREIVALPLIVKDKILVVVSLASLGSFAPRHLKVLEQSQTTLSAVLANLLAGEVTERMAAELRTKNDALAASNEELRAQSEELLAQTDELREQRKRLKEADRLKSTFLSSVSHELRTPLAAILGASELMLARRPGEKPEEDHEFLRVIERNGRRLLRLINDILDLTKIEAGHLEVSLHEVNPAGAVEAALETVRLLAEEKGLALRVRLDDVGPLVTDGDRLTQILVNLLMNAVKYTDAGQVELRLSGQGDSTCFAVRDTGIGIAEADQARIFEEFMRLEGAARRPGTGLGLAISRKLAHLLGGRLSLESAPGKGSTFTLTLPRGRLPGDAPGASRAGDQAREGEGRELRAKRAESAVGPRVLPMDDGVRPEPESRTGA